MDPADFASYIHEVTVPGGVEAAAWGRQHATADPEIMPSGWPESTRMCLMVVYRKCQNLDHDCETRALLVTRPEAMHFVATRDGPGVVPQLWYRLPRRLFTPDVCPALKPEHWPEDE